MQSVKNRKNAVLGRKHGIPVQSYVIVKNLIFIRSIGYYTLC